MFDLILKLPLESTFLSVKLKTPKKKCKYFKNAEPIFVSSTLVWFGKGEVGGWLEGNIFLILEVLFLAFEALSSSYVLLSKASVRQFSLPEV